MNVIINILDLNIENSRKYHYPHCGCTDICEYNDSIDCPKCRKEFEKQDCGELDDENIISIEEKLFITH